MTSGPDYFATWIYIPEAANLREQVHIIGLSFNAYDKSLLCMCYLPGIGKKSKIAMYAEMYPCTCIYLCWSISLSMNLTQAPWVTQNTYLIVSKVTISERAVLEKLEE